LDWRSKNVKCTFWFWFFQIFTVFYVGRAPIALVTCDATLPMSTPEPDAAAPNPLAIDEISEPAAPNAPVI
jgi:hypothetical protein